MFQYLMKWLVRRDDESRAQKGWFMSSDTCSVLRQGSQQVVHEIELISPDAYSELAIFGTEKERIDRTINRLAITLAECKEYDDHGKSAMFLPAVYLRFSRQLKQHGIEKQERRAVVDALQSKVGVYALIGLST